MNLDQHPSRLDDAEPAQPSQYDITQPARPVKPDVTQPARRLRPEVTQPARPVRPDMTPPAPPVRRPPAQQQHPQSAYPQPRQQRRPAPRRVAKPRRRASRRLWRGCLLPLLALALIVLMGGALVYGLFLTPSPTNILILGIDRRPGEGTAVRTDTILLAHADPAHRRLTLLSIPRDLWVTIPGKGEGRINTAHVFGELEAAGSGPARVAETIAYNFGVRIDHTLLLDFSAFREVIDAAGGIEIDVPTPVIDNAYPTEDYGTMRIEIPAGLQHMDAETALQYARSRHGSSDFDRAARQQQILIALIKKLTDPKGWHLIPGVYQAFQNAVETDMNFRDLAILVFAWQRAGNNGLDQIVIDRTLTTPFNTPQGAAVLLPNWELIHPQVRARFMP